MVHEMYRYITCTGTLHIHWHTSYMCAPCACRGMPHIYWYVTVTGMSCQCCIPIQVCRIHVHVSGMYRNVTLAGMPEQDQ